MKSVLIVLALLVIVATSSFLSAMDKKILNEVKAGEKTLTCVISGKGLIEIDPSLVTGFDSEFGWSFSNGSARKCFVK